jgi:large subunit ribosomal protein L18
MSKHNPLFARRRNRVRFRLTKGSGAPRLSVYRSGRHIYAQVIDDTEQKTLASASSNEAKKADASAKTWNLAAAEMVGKLIAERAKGAGVKRVKFDRGGYLYHGRVKALADAAREGGLEF